MREVKELASTIKDAVAGLRKTNESVKSALTLKYSEQASMLTNSAPSRKN